MTWKERSLGPPGSFVFCWQYVREDSWQTGWCISASSLGPSEGLAWQGLKKVECVFLDTRRWSFSGNIYAEMSGSRLKKTTEMRIRRHRTRAVNLELIHIETTPDAQE